MGEKNSRFCININEIIPRTIKSERDNNVYMHFLFLNGILKFLFKIDIHIYLKDHLMVTSMASIFLVLNLTLETWFYYYSFDKKMKNQFVKGLKF